MRDDRQLNLFALSNGDGIRSSNKLTISCYFHNLYGNNSIVFLLIVID